MHYIVIIYDRRIMMIGIVLIIVGVILSIASFSFFAYIRAGAGEIGMIISGIIGILCVVFGILTLV